ncbi:hypothetical protein C8R46DRAFT_1341875 [Mycena filopes]|nr:hypothetical protein C8R46DRAFT_1341875 [Mycena filopes]
MRLTTAAFVLSAVSLALAHAECAKCPLAVNEYHTNAPYDLVVYFHDDIENTTFCGYREHEKAKEGPQNEGFCTYYATGKKDDGDLECPEQVETEKCPEEK